MNELDHYIATYEMSPNLPSRDFFLFPGLKRALKGYRCADIQAVQTAVTEQLCRIPERVFQDCFEDPQKRRTFYIDAGGSYSEGDP